MATYTETSLKIKKSDLVIYIIALIAFVLMIVVLMSDKIGVTKKVTSLFNNDNNHANAANHHNAQTANSQPAAIQPANVETGINQTAVTDAGNSSDNSSGANNSDPTRQLVTELQQNNNSAGSSSSTAQPMTTESTRQGAPQSNSRINSAERNSDASMDNETAVRPVRERDSAVSSSSTRNADNEPEISSRRNRSHNAVRARESRINTPSASAARITIVREPAAQSERISRNTEEAESMPSTRIRSSLAAPQAPSVTRVTSRVTNVQPDGNLTVVKKIQALAGDNLWKIAQRNGVRTINIILVNRLSNPDFIFPGQTINIPNK